MTATAIAALVAAFATHACAQSAPETAEPSSSPVPPSPSEDVVVLRDATVLRGSLAELQQGRSLTLALADGTPRTVAWDDIRETRGPSFPQAWPTVRTPALAPLRIESEGAVLEVGHARVYSRSVRTDRLLAYRGAFEGPMCHTPCAMLVRPGLTVLYAGGSDIETAFPVLDVPATGAHVVLHAPSQSRTMLGHALLYTGAALLPVGAGFLVAGIASGSLPVIVSAAIGTALGATGVVSGIALLARTHSGVARFQPLDALASPRGTIQIPLWVF